MSNFNNLDIIILIIITISALIALNRGFIKEVLSIMGWVLGAAAVIYLLPVINPLTKMYVDGEMMSAVVSAIVILIVFFVLWIFLTARMVGKVRDSKLSNMDRFIGFLFGILRGGLLVVLLNITVSWTVDPKDQPDIFWDSKLYQFAGQFAEPIEKLIPQKTKDVVNQNAAVLEIEGEGGVLDENMDDLFEKLASPQIKKTGKVDADSLKEVLGYDKSEQQSLDRLIDITAED